MLNENQSGFRPNHSTSSSLLNITEKWLDAIDRGEYIGIVALDLKKAFDTVNHSILLKKLVCYNLSPSVIKWFESYLSERTHITNVNGVKSDEQICKCGIPQGSILGPLLFIMYINDLPNHVTNMNVSMYADDTILFYSSKDINDIVFKINKDLENVENWLSKNKLSLNVSKTNYMIIGTPQKLANISDVDLNINIKGTSIKKVTNCKHLGVIIDENMIWKNQVDKVIKKVSTGLYFLRKSTNILPRHVQSMLYKSIIATHFDYCNIVWGRCKKQYHNKLQVLQNRAAKIITGTSVYGSSTQALNDLNWKNLDQKLYYNESAVMYKTLNDMAPRYLTKRFENKETKYDMRNKCTLKMDRPKTEYKKRSFTYRGAKLWNSLDINVKNATSLPSFKKQYWINY